MAVKYKCPHCDHEEEVRGSPIDGPVYVHNKRLGLTMRFESTLVKNLAEAEVKHLMAAHPGLVAGDKKEA